MDKLKGKKREDLKKEALKMLSRLEWKEWYATIFFFLILLLASVFIWWKSFYSPQPSLEVKQEVKSSERNYDTMKLQIEGVMGILREREERYDNPVDFSSQRELFIKIGGQEKVEESGEEQEGSAQEQKNIQQGTEVAPPQNDGPQLAP